MPDLTPAAEPITPPPAAPLVPPAAPVVEPPPLPPPPVIPDPVIEEDDQRDGVTITGTGLALPAPALQRIKDRAVARGRLDGETALLKQLGVSTIEEAQAIVTKSKEQETMPPDPITPPPTAPVIPAAAAQVVPPPVAPPPPIVPPVVDDKALPEATRRALREQREAAEGRATAAAADAEATRKAAAEAATAAAVALERVREDGKIRESMIVAGVVEVDFVWTKLQEHIASLDPAAKLAFNDEARTKWLGDYKAAKPFLFREHVAPANTSGARPPPGTPPSPGTVAAGAGAAGAKDYRSMTDAERQAAAPPGIKIPQGSRNRKPGR